MALSLKASWLWIVKLLEIMKAVEIRIKGYFMYNIVLYNFFTIVVFIYLIFIFALTGSVENEIR